MKKVIAIDSIPIIMPEEDDMDMPEVVEDAEVDMNIKPVELVVIVIFDMSVADG